MSRLVGFSCTDESLKSIALKALAQEAVLEDVSESSGVGLAWVQRGRSLLRANPRPSSNSPSIHALLADVPSRAAIGFIREAGLSAVGANELQPYRFREWVFAYEGEAPESREGRDALLASVADFIRGNIKGRDPAEVMFHHLLGQLHRADALDIRPFDAEVAAQAIARAVTKAEQEAALANYTALIGAERDVFMVRLGAPLWFRTIVGLEAADEEPMFAGHRPKVTKYPAFRAMMVVNGERPDESWQEIPDRTVSWMGEDWTLEQRAIGPL